MLTGVFNSIILLGNLARRVVGHAARHHVRIQFNGASNDNPSFTCEQKKPDTLRGRFNSCNDNLTIDDEKKKKDSAKMALIRALVDMLKEIARRVAEGTAALAEALGLIAQLDFLGIKVSGLPLYSPGAPLDHKKAAYTRHVHRRPAFAA
jgi:hypothetical protein